MKIHIFALRWKDEIRKKFQARTGFEPMTSAIPVSKLSRGLDFLAELS